MSLCFVVESERKKNEEQTHTFIASQLKIVLDSEKKEQTCVQLLSEPANEYVIHGSVNSATASLIYPKFCPHIHISRSRNFSLILNRLLARSVDSISSPCRIFCSFSIYIIYTSITNR